MKKTISITISGLIFHIEEDGYQVLRHYLDEVQKYFAAYQDGSEIYADIENRIAEVFTTKLNAGKAVITDEDVKLLVASLGSISDFKAAEEFEVEVETKQPTPNEDAEPIPSPKRLERNLRSKMLGGVCAGISYYLGIDTIWIRLLTLALFFGMIAIPGFNALPGFVVISYLILWIAMPGTYAVDESEMPAKKLMRNPKNRVFAGVAGGLASYFNVDVTIIRVLFVVTTLFFGSGLIIYISLWIVMPKARTLTDLMYMSGEPVTLSGIDQRMKKGGQEGFRQEPIGARFADGFGQLFVRIFGLFITLIAVSAGIILGVVGLAFLFAITVTAAVLFKLVNPESNWISHVQIGDLFPGFLADEISNMTIISGFGLGLVPVVFLLLVAISLIARQWMIKIPTAIALISIGVVSLAVFAYSGLPIVDQFKKKSHKESVIMLPMPNPGTLTLTLHDIDGENMVVPPKIDLTVVGYAGDSIKLIQSISAHGKSTDSAVANTKAVEYNILQVDSVLSFDSNLKLKEGGRYRIQKGKMKLHIPFNKPFRFDPKVYEILLNTITPYGFYKSDLRDNIFQFDAKGLQCITCEEQPSNPDVEPSNSDEDNWDDEQ